jgi:hypothetical protein
MLRNSRGEMAFNKPLYILGGYQRFDNDCKALHQYATLIGDQSTQDGATESG